MNTGRATWVAGLEAALLAATTAAATSALAPLYADGGWVLPAVLAVLAGSAAGTAARARGWSAGAVTLGTAAVLVTVSAYGLAPDGHGLLPTPARLAAGVDNLVGAPARILTVTPPVEAQNQMLALPVLLGAVGAVAATRLAGRREALLPLLPPLLVFLAALLLTAQAREPRWGVTALLLLGSLLTALLRAQVVDDTASPDLVAGPADPDGDASRRGAQRAGRLAVGLPVVAGVVVLAVTAAEGLPVATGQARFDVRELHDSPVELQDRVNPLSDVRRQLVSPPEHLFTVRLASNGAAVDRVRVTALDRYDGAAWSSSARFLRTGARLPAGPPLRDTARAELDVELAGLEPPYLPHVGRPLDVDAEDVAFDATSGLLVSTQIPFSGLHYRLTAEAVTPRVRLDRARPLTGPSAGGLLTLPALAGEASGVPDRLRALAHELAAQGPTPVAGLTALEGYLRALPYDLRARPGHSYGALARVLPGTPDHARAVTEEQTAAVFAVMARMLGYPSRVAVGYLLDQSDLRAEGYVVTTGRAAAWPEVQMDGLGWVPFDPTGQRTTPPVTGRSGGRSGGAGQGAGGEGAGDTALPAETGTVDVSVSVTAERSLARAGLLLLAVAVLTVVGAAVGVVAAKGWRRRRRRSGPAAARITGAWRETRDRLEEQGLPASPALTPDEVAEAAAERLGAPVGRPVGDLAPIVSAALFAAEQPNDMNADDAWALEAEVRRRLQEQRSWPQAVRVALDPRPLLPVQRRSPRGRPPVRPASRPSGGTR